MSTANHDEKAISSLAHLTPEQEDSSAAANVLGKKVELCEALGGEAEYENIKRYDPPVDHIPLGSKHKKSTGRIPTGGY